MGFAATFNLGLVLAGLRASGYRLIARRIRTAEQVCIDTVLQNPPI